MVSIVDSLFDYNIAYEEGGVIDSIYSSLDINNSIFTNNIARY
jgi:hypothetical protein